MKISFKIFILIILFFKSETLAKSCLEGCPRIYLPVCACQNFKDCKQFDNECILNTQNCEKGTRK